jgi:hypothetical protein
MAAGLLASPSLIILLAEPPVIRRNPSQRGVDDMKQVAAITSAVTGLLLGLCAALTPGLAQQNAQQNNIEERRACTPDVMRLCRQFVPNTDLINKCLFEKKAELSPACQTVMFGPQQNVAPPPATPVTQPSPATRPSTPTVQKANVVVRKKVWKKRSHDCDDDDD